MQLVGDLDPQLILDHQSIFQFGGVQKRRLLICFFGQNSVLILTPEGLNSVL